MNFISKIALIILSVFVLSTLSVLSFAVNTYFVEPTGSDSNNGSVLTPWKTIQYGADQLSPGDILYLRGGNYNEKINITKSGNSPDLPITLSAFGDEKPVLDGTNIKGYDMITINSEDYITIKGLTIQNNFQDIFTAGIVISGGSGNITIDSCILKNISTNGDTNLFSEYGSNPIYCISESPNSPNHNIIIQNNEIFDCNLGMSEALTITQNTIDFQVINNKIYNVSNIGIDIAGHYGDWVGLESDNQARYGLVSGNTVYDCHSTYGTHAASGIYVDGGRDTIIENNSVYSCDYGITIGCENNGKSASNITLRNNIVYNNEKSGISIGGWHETAGFVKDSIISNNTVYRNNSLASPYQGELAIKITRGNIQIINNIFSSRQISRPDFDNDKFMYPMLYNVFPASNVKLDYNLWFSKAGIESTYYRFSDKEYLGFVNYKLGSQNDKSSIFSSPLFTSSNNNNFLLSKNSPGIDLSQNGSLDCGAYDSGKDEYLGKVPYKLWKPPTSKLNSKIGVVNNNKRIVFWLNSPKLNNFTQIFIDKDNDDSTGYQSNLKTSGGFDYLLENNSIFQYSGDGKKWKWKNLGSINFKTQGNLKKFDILLSDFNVDKTVTLGLYYVSYNSKDIGAKIHSVKLQKYTVTFKKTL